MEVALRQEPVLHQAGAEATTEVMLDAVDDYMGADFGNLEDFTQLQYTLPVGQDDSMQPSIQDPSLGVDSFSSFGGGARPGGSLDALGLAGMEYNTAAHGGITSPALGPTPPPM